MKHFLLIAMCATIMAACDKEMSVDEPYYAYKPSDGYSICEKVCIMVLDKDSCDMLNPNYDKDGKKFDMALYKDPEMKEKRPEYLLLDSISDYYLNADTATYYYIYFYAPHDYSKEIIKDSIIEWYSVSYLSIDGISVDTIRTRSVEYVYHSQSLRDVFFNGEDVTRLGLVIKN